MMVEGIFSNDFLGHNLETFDHSDSGSSNASKSDRDASVGMQLVDYGHLENVRENHSNHGRPLYVEDFVSRDQRGMNRAVGCLQVYKYSEVVPDQA